MKKICSLLILFTSLYTSSCIAEDSASDEAERILNVIEGKIDGVFLINIMGGYFPVPSRFIWVPDTTSSNLKLLSGPIFEFVNDLEEQLKTPTGTIIIGPLSQCEFCKKELDPLLAKRAHIELIDEHKSVKMIRPHLKGKSENNHFIIYNKDKYIIIADSRTKSWHASFEVLKKYMR